VVLPVFALKRLYGFTKGYVEAKKNIVPDAD
jgi:hypothetical protein